MLHYSTPSGSPYSYAPSRFLSEAPLPAIPPNIPMPWIVAYFVLPGFAGLRVPARLIGLLLIMLALLSAYAIAWFQNRVGTRFIASNAITRKEKIQATEQTPRRIETRFIASHIFRRIAIQCLLILIPCAILLEAIPAYLPVTQVPTGNAIPAVYQWLATHGDQQPIVEIPMASVDRNFVSMNEAWYDYYAIYHYHPIANGWSGYRPLLTFDMSMVLLNFPSRSSLSILKQYHIQYVVLHLQFYSSTIAKSILAQAESNPELRRVAVFGSDSVWQVI
jgi:hypothetical protein